MYKQKAVFKSPSITLKHNGKPRMVGFELEFTGLTLDQTMAALQRSLGGKTKTISSVEQELAVDSLGTFNVELDWEFLRRKAAQLEQQNKESDWINLLSQAAMSSLLIPMEVACPPIPIDRLDDLDPVLTALREAGAVGTEDSPLAAYGVHINADIPKLDAATVFSYLRAFALLQWWLVDMLEVDMSRKISPYIDLYPEAYLKQLLSQREPTMAQIMSDYLEHNPSRNRALDMLPLLARVDRHRVQAVVHDPKIKPRPAFHYRLPNCQIERKDWSLAISWNSWWVVEQLAHQPQHLDQLGDAFLEADRPIIGVSRKTWVEFINVWLIDHELA